MVIGVAGQEGERQFGDVLEPRDGVASVVDESGGEVGIHAAQGQRREVLQRLLA